MTQSDPPSPIPPDPPPDTSIPSPIPPEAPADEPTIDDIQFLNPDTGEPVIDKPKPGDPDFVPPIPIIEKADVEYDPDLDPDVQHNKGMAILAYILFFLPLLLAPNSKFARYHANQGLLVFILWFVAIIGCVVLYFVQLATDFIFQKIIVLADFFSCAIYLIQPAMLIGVIALMVVGILHAAGGEKKPIPLFGQIKIIQ